TAKKPSVRYWEARGGYGCWIDGTQHILAKDPDDCPTRETYLATLDRFRKLLSLDANRGTDDYLVSSLLNQYRIPPAGAEEEHGPRGCAQELTPAYLCRGLHKN